MRRCRAALTASSFLLGALLVSFIGAGPAAAGGPTSALLVVPGAGNTASLYTSDADYATLARLVGAFAPDGSAGRVDGTGAGHEAGTGVTVTWLIHDVQVWRVDRIYPEAPGGPWISTQVAADGTGSIWDSPVMWHTTENGKELVGLLDRLGVGSVPAAAAEPAVGTTTDRADRPVRSPAPAGEDTWPSWAWGLAGVSLGAALALALTRAVAARGRGMIREDRIILEEDDAWPTTSESTPPAPPGALSSRSTR